jgi:hypothetical protein
MHDRGSALRLPQVARSITTACRLIAGATSANTRRAYETGWRQFTAHAQGLGREPQGAHPALVATFLGALRDRGASAQTLATTFNGSERFVCTI